MAMALKEDMEQKAAVNKQLEELAKSTGTTPPNPPAAGTKTHLMTN